MGMRLTYQPPSSGPEGLEPSCAEARGCPLSLKKGQIVCIVNLRERLEHSSPAYHEMTTVGEQ